MEWVINATPLSLYCRERDPVSVYRRLGGPQGRSERMRKISLPPGFDPWTVQTVANHYTDGAIPAHMVYT